MPYTKKQIYSALAAQSNADSNFSGRDAWCTNLTNLAVEGGWIRREVKASSVLTTTAGPAEAASAAFPSGLHCDLIPAAVNDWAIFREDVTPKLKVFIIDQFVASPASRMACIKAGASDGTYTSVGYVESGSTSGDAIFAVLFDAIKKLYPDAVLEEYVGTRQMLVSGGTNQNINLGLTFHMNTLTSGERFRGGGWIIQCQPSTKLINTGLFGLENYLELYFTGTRNDLGALLPGANGLVVSASKTFGKFPHRNPTPVQGTYDNSLSSDGSSGKRYRTAYTLPRYWNPCTMFINAHQIVMNSEALTATEKFYLFASALPLFDNRTLDTQGLLITESTIFSVDTTGSGASGFFNGGYLSGVERKVINGGAAYNKVRYDTGSGAALASGSTQLAYTTTGRQLGNIFKGVPWVGNLSPANEAWLGWSMTGRGSGDLLIFYSHPWDMMILCENTSSPGAAFGSSASGPQFFQDGANWKRYTKKAAGSGADPRNRAMTVCLRVGEIV